MVGRKNGKEEISIAEAVRIILSQRQSLLQCLSMGVVNYTWAAQLILDDVKKLTGRERVGIDAVKAALIRLEQDLAKEENILREKIGCIISKSTLELQDDISLVTMRRFVVEKNIKNMLEVAEKSRFFNFSQGSRTYTLVVSSEDLPKIKSRVDREGILDEVEEQSAIVIISPYEIMNTPGVISYLTRQLYRYGVNITQIISCYTDTIIIVPKKDSLKTLGALQEAIESSRKLCGKSKRSS